ncbi:MAG: Lrp/AsnC family transcriptional regulator [Bradyrhizobiaceae bacterium]|nr:Lrp/AsnC family transcriptional regulator [Bradyrhizobiaceae bacterium]
MKSLDLLICAELQRNARLSLNEVAERVGSSVPTVSEHVKRMEAEGIIKGYHAVIDAASAGLDVTAFIFVDIDSSTNYENFRKQCKQRSDVLEVHAITGTASHLAKVRCRTTRELEELLSAMQRWKGVTRTLTNVVLSTHKETLQLHLQENEG